MTRNTKKEAMVYALQNALEKTDMDMLREGRVSASVRTFTNGISGPHAHAVVTVTITKRFTGHADME